MDQIFILVKYTRSHGRPEILWVDADVCADSCKRMIRAGFLSPSERRKLEACVRSHRADHGVARRANAILLLDDGKSCQAIAEFLYLDDDTIRGWYRPIARLAGMRCPSMDGKVVSLE